MSAIRGVLAVSPGDPTALALEQRLAAPPPGDLEARTADNARGEQRQARLRAEAAQAATLAPDEFEVATGLAQAAENLYRDRQFSSAEGTFLEAADAFDTARTAADRNALNQMEAARQQMATARAVAPADGDAEAVAEERRALELADQGSLVEAAAAYRRAASLYEDAARRQAAQNRMAAARQDMETAKAGAPAGRDPDAEAEELRAQRLDAEGNPVEAATSYRRAADLYRASTQREEADTAALRNLLTRYEAAYESHSLDDLKSIWPSLGGALERTLANNFETMRSTQIDLELTGEFQVSGDTASVSGRRRVTQADETRTVPASEEDVSFTFRRSSGTWVIDAVNAQPR